MRDECFYTETELVTDEATGEKVAPTGAAVEWTAKEPSYFFKLSEWTRPLLDHYAAQPDAIGPKSRRNEVVAFLEQEGGLRDLSVSRTSFSWGIPVPGDDGHIIYVWIDALTNYLSALGFGSSADASADAPLGGNAETFWPSATHVVGKDILRFHAVYWPALLMAAGLPPPRRLFAHGWWTKDGEKISKSLGNVVEPFGQ